MKYAAITALSFLLLTMLLAGCAAGEPKFPDDYALLPHELPEGYELATLSDAEKKEIGVTSNPGLITDKSIIESNLDGTDNSQVEGLYIGLYTQAQAGDQSHMLGILAIKYPKPEVLQQEAPELIKSFNEKNDASYVFLQREDVLMLVASQGSRFLTKPDSEQTSLVAQKLKKRLGLADFTG